MLLRAHAHYRPAAETPDPETLDFQATVWADDFYEEGIPAHMVAVIYREAREARMEGTEGVQFMPTIDELQRQWRKNHRRSEADRRADAAVAETQRKLAEIRGTRPAGIVPGPELPQLPPSAVPLQNVPRTSSIPPTNGADYLARNAAMVERARQIEAEALAQAQPQAVNGE